MQRARVVNYHARPLNEMKAGETLYAQRTVGGMFFTFFGKLVRIDRGQVVIEGCWIEPEHAKGWEQPPVTERFAARKCFLWGRAFGESHDHCIWFTSINNRAGSKPADRKAATAAHNARQTAPAAQSVQPSAQLDLIRGTTEEHGKCCACSRHVESIIRVDMLRIIFRVCDTCAVKLAQELNAHVEPTRVEH